MKSIRYIVTCVLLTIVEITMAMETDTHYEEHSLRIIVDTAVSKQKVENLLVSDSVLGSWITSIRPSFPSSQDEMLQRVYFLEYTCSRIQMESRLLGFSWIEKIMPIEKTPENMLYEPSDLFWKETRTNNPKCLWHLTKIEAEKAWNITKGSPNIKIAVLDQIIDATHPDLQSQLVYKYDPYTPSIKMEFDGSSHGTTVASFVAASTDDPENSPAKLASIGFNCRIVGYSTANFLEKIHHATFVEKVSVIVSCAGNGIRSTPQNAELEKKVVKEILDHGTIIVAPAGNGWGGTRNDKDGSLVPFYPFHPSYDNRIIIVSSTDINDNHTYIKDGKDCTHSHFKDVTVCAPGYSMMGALPWPDAADRERWPYYADCNGTSFSAPIVAGLCGLMKSVFPDLTPAKAKEILMSTADPIKDANLYPNMVGAGRINAYKAVLATRQYAETCQVSYKNQTISGTVNKEACTLKMENTAIKKGASVTFTIDTEAELGEGFSVEEGATFEIRTK